MKKILTFLCVCALALACLLVLPARAETATEGDYIYSVVDGKATITGYTGAGGNITLPSTLGDYPVTAIGSGAFAFSRLLFVRVPDSVITIGSSAFYESGSLEGAILGANVTTIEDNAFSGCAGMAGVSFGASVTTIGDAAFGGCYNLVDVYYDGTTAQWNSIEIGDDNAYLTNATIHCAEDPSAKDYTYEVTDGNATITGYTGAGGDITIPSTLGGYPVTAIGTYAFASCTSLTKITISDSVTTIGDYAFNSCANLTQIAIPDSVTTIGDYAFDFCSNLTTVTLGNGVTAIGKSAFSECRSLSSVTLGDSLISIGKSAFNNCINLTSVAIPDSVTTIGEQAFYNCASMTQVILPDSITTIEDYVFFSCTSLNTIILPERVTSICDNAFLGCDGLTSITIGGSVATIGSSAFRNCPGLTDVYFPGTEEQWNAISIQGSNECLTNAQLHFLLDYGTCGENLTWKLDAEGTLTISGTGAMTDYEDRYSLWHNNHNIKRVVIEEGVTHIGAGIFSACTEITEITIPNSVTTIGKEAFSYCYRLKELTISANVTDIGHMAFYACYDLSGIWVDENNPNYCSDDRGVLFNKNKTQLIRAPGALRGSYDIPVGVTAIADGAFHGCDELKGVTIPEGVISIGADAFNYCTVLKEVAIPSSVTTIGEFAFYDCEALEQVTLSEGVNTIGRYAFSLCHALTEVSLPASVSEISYSAFQDCAKLAGIWVNPNNPNYSCDTYGVLFNKNKTQLIRAPGGLSGSYAIPDSVTTMENYAFANCTKLTSITISKRLTSIPDDAFYFCSGLADVTIPEGITQIGYGAFYGCDSLHVLTLPDGLSKICESAFGHCPNLIDLVVPASVTEIADSAFDYGTNLTNVYYLGTHQQWEQLVDNNTISGIENATIHYNCMKPESTGVFGDYSYEFKDCKITITGYTGEGGDITIPAEIGGYPVTAIGKDAFRNCSGIYSVVIPDSVITIGDYAFYNCYYLRGVTLGKNVTTIGNSAFAASRLQSITIPESVTTIGSSAFAFCQLLGVTIPDSVTTIGSGAFYENLSLQGVTIGANVTTIGDNAFSGCTGLTGVRFGAKVTTIGEGAFYRCSLLTGITLPDSVTTIGREAFMNCVSLTGITIPDAITSIGQDAFSGCSQLVYTTYDNAKYLGNESNPYLVLVSATAKDISSCQVHADTKLITEGAFSGCSTLAAVVFNGNIFGIGKSAFSGCNALTVVFYPGTQAQKEAIAVGKSNDAIVNAVWHYEVEEATFAEQSCYYCKACNNYFLADGSYAMATVVFENWDGTVLSTQKYKYWDIIEKPADPTKEADETFTYHFDGWGWSEAHCVGNKTYKATFTPVFIDYTVVFKNEDGTIWSEKTYHYGDKVSEPATAIKEADETYTYEFAGWTPEVATCTGNATYTATYNPVYIDYIVEFVNSDGTVLSSKTYHYGDTVDVPADPTKEADNSYTYTFNGWNQEVVACAGNTTYRATYLYTPIQYVVEFRDWDGRVISSTTYTYFDRIRNIPNNPTRPADETYTYTFAGWDQPVAEYCRGDVTYTATYKGTYIDYRVIFRNDDGSQISYQLCHYGDTVIMPSTPRKEANETYTYTFAGWDREVATTCNGNATYWASYTPVYIDYLVTFMDWDGTVISSMAYHYGQRIEMPDNPTREPDETYAYAFVGWTPAVPTTCNGSATYIATYGAAAYVEYTVEFRNWNGTLISSEIYHYGQEIQLPETPTKPETITHAYIFIGWDQEVPPCTGDAVYTAVFQEVKKTAPIQNGWYQTGGKWYYYQNGELVTSSWRRDSKGWCYLGADGAMAVNSWVPDSKDLVYVGSNGYMVYNKWVQDSNGWRYAGSDGYVVRNKWQKDSIGWCYLGSDGYMVVNNWVPDSKGLVYVGSNGYMVVNQWVADEGGLRYVGSDGYITRSKWIKRNNQWCYLDTNGYMATSCWKKDSKGWCYLGADGYMITNQWVPDSVGIVYVGSDGYMVVNKWIEDATGWRYAGPQGYYLKNCWQKDSKGWCYLQDNGYMVTEDWVKDSVGWCYLDASGYWDGKYHDAPPIEVA